MHYPNCVRIGHSRLRTHTCHSIPMSHKLDPDRSPQFAANKFTPVIVELDPGQMLLFSTIAHAGYGQWALNEAHVRPVPSGDDLLAIDIDKWHVRYQCHV